MIEAIAMLTVLAGMGVYLVKSADLPEDLKNRSAELQRENYSIPEKNKFAHLSAIKKPETKPVAQVVSVSASELERQAKLEVINKEIDARVLAITTLEQEIRVNNAKNAEIEKQIANHLARLETLRA